jgi:ATP-dependent Clp protease adaptor protein ClpS
MIADEETLVEIQIVTERERSLVLHNDDHNTFDHVIECLVGICNHDPIQAEQCAMIVHTKGKCTVKHGAFSDLAWRKEMLLAKGLSVMLV